jgi:hypothetical protein
LVFVSLNKNMNYKKILGLGSSFLLLGGRVDSVKMQLPANGTVENKVQSTVIKELQPKKELKINEVLAAQIKEFSKPTNQDIAAVEGGGFNPGFTKYLELHYLSPRRQTQQVPGELFSMIPKNFGRDFAIVVPERLLQQPTKILELEGKKK